MHQGKQELYNHTYTDLRISCQGSSWRQPKSTDYLFLWVGKQEEYKSKKPFLLLLQGKLPALEKSC